MNSPDLEIVDLLRVKKEWEAKVKSNFSTEDIEVTFIWRGNTLTANIGGEIQAKDEEDRSMAPMLYLIVGAGEHHIVGGWSLNDLEDRDAGVVLGPVEATFNKVYRMLKSWADKQEV